MSYTWNYLKKSINTQAKYFDKTLKPFNDKLEQSMNDELYLMKCTNSPIALIKKGKFFYSKKYKQILQAIKYQNEVSYYDLNDQFITYSTVNVTLEDENVTNLEEVISLGTSLVTGEKVYGKKFLENGEEKVLCLFDNTILDYVDKRDYFFENTIYNYSEIYSTSTSRYFGRSLKDSIKDKMKMINGIVHDSSHYESYCEKVEDNFRIPIKQLQHYYLDLIPLNYKNKLTYATYDGVIFYEADNSEYLKSKILTE